MSARWEHFPHEADMGVRGFGSTKAEAFEQAALAMTAVVADIRTVGPQKRVGIECEAPDAREGGVAGADGSGRLKLGSCSPEADYALAAR